MGRPEGGETILKQAGATKTWRGPTVIPPFNNHEVGGCRMGNDPATSVVNKYCQSHELPNMFVASDSVFPTYFGYYPGVHGFSSRMFQRWRWWGRTGYVGQHKRGGWGVLL